MLQEWESGSVMLSPMTQVETSVIRDHSYSSCGWEEICFCGLRPCRMPEDWEENSPLQLRSQRRLDTPPQQWQIPFSMRAEVEVIFGLEVTAESPLLGQLDLASSWNFNEEHEVWQPWAQRNMFSFCTSLPEELQVTSRRCWIEDFRRYVISKGLRFPLPRDLFDEEVGVFSITRLTGRSSSRDYLWTRGGQVKASFMSFTIDVHRFSATALALEHQRKWDAYLDRYNAEASRFARDAWHTSSLWVRAEAQNELISSTVNTLIIVVILAFLGMVVFTHNAGLSLLVVLATMGVVSGLFFFITVVMSWAIGPIEVIGLIVFIGYAVTYSLHIAHRYGSIDAVDSVLPDEVASKLSPAAGARYRRAQFALQTIGGAAIGSAATTAGSATFLVFCTLTIFQKLGGVVLAVTAMSILMALGPLPAVLLLVGPQDPGRRCVPSVGEFFEGLGHVKCAFEKLLAWRPRAAAPKEVQPVRGPSGTTGSCGVGADALAAPDAARGRPLPKWSEAMPAAGAVAGGTVATRQPAACGASSSFPEMDFDIGIEAPLECIWTRQPGGTPRAVDGRRRPAAATL